MSNAPQRCCRGRVAIVCDCRNNARTVPEHIEDVKLIQFLEMCRIVVFILYCALHVLCGLAVVLLVIVELMRICYMYSDDEIRAQRATKYNL